MAGKRPGWLREVVQLYVFDMFSCDLQMRGVRRLLGFAMGRDSCRNAVGIIFAVAMDVKKK